MMINWLILLMLLAAIIGLPIWIILLIARSRRPFLYGFLTLFVPVACLVCFSVLALMAAILVPSFARARSNTSRGVISVPGVSVRAPDTLPSGVDLDLPGMRVQTGSESSPFSVDVTMPGMRVTTGRDGEQTRVLLGEAAAPSPPRVQLSPPPAPMVPPAPRAHHAATATNCEGIEHFAEVFEQQMGSIEQMAEGAAEQAEHAAESARQQVAEAQEEGHRAAATARQQAAVVQEEARRVMEEAQREVEAMRQGLDAQRQAMFDAALRNGASLGSGGGGRLIPGTAVGQPWKPSALHPFVANTYPTRISGALALAKSLLRDYLVNAPTTGPAVRTVSISGNQPVASEMVRRLPVEAKVIPGWSNPNVVFAGAGHAAPPEPGSGELYLDVTVQASSSNPDAGGHVEVTLRSGDGQLSAGAAYADAYWSEDFQTWVRMHPGHSWVFATSGDPCGSEQQAVDQAREAAVTEVQKRVEALVAQGQPVSHFRDPAYLHQQIANELRTGGLPVRQFTQQFPRPYGDVWRCALLVDASTDYVKHLAVKYCQYEARVQAYWFKTLLSTAALLLLIIGVYLLLNAATRGYYVWGLRVMLLAVAGAGVWLVLNWT